jgi:hypothetical protein
MPRAEYTTMYSKLLAYNKGQRAPSHTPQHLSENSWNHQGKANVMASLHCHLLCDVPIYGWACICINVLLASKHYHNYRANCLAVVGVITGVRTERHNLQSQYWSRDACGIKV